jgi:hypothetical protein
MCATSMVAAILYAEAASGAGHDYEQLVLANTSDFLDSTDDFRRHGVVAADRLEGERRVGEMSMEAKNRRHAWTSPRRRCTRRWSSVE